MDVASTCFHNVTIMITIPKLLGALENVLDLCVHHTFSWEK